MSTVIRLRVMRTADTRQKNLDPGDFCHVDARGLNPRSSNEDTRGGWGEAARVPLFRPPAVQESRSVQGPAG